jgi:glutathione synthase/RimK-type ligase-like ATP-grasp enzyme
MSATLGIIVCYTRQKTPPFPEADYFLQLAKIARDHSLEVLVFNPRHINWTNRTVGAWHITNNRWHFAIRPLPLVIYDRCYYTTLSHFYLYRPHILRIHKDKTVQFLGRALGGKWQTYQILQTNKYILPHLPETKIVKGPDSVRALLNKYDAICLKPNGGSHGIGVISIERQPTGFFIRGRTKENQPFIKNIATEKQLLSWIQSFIQKSRYLVQPFLSLQTADGLPFDLRILVQKNHLQQWETTGKAIRIGQGNGITSNLHGGGKALRWEPFLAKHFTAEQEQKIELQIKQLTKLVPSQIESQHGKLVELGLDIGIDRHAHVWLIEVNSKPGRSVFLQTGDLKTRKRSMELPIQYAKALLSQKVRGYV